MKTIKNKVIPVKIDLYSNCFKLNADFYKAEVNKKAPTMIMLHGYPGGQNDPMGICNIMCQNGINVLFFNVQGTWSSEGIFSFESSIENVGDALKFLQAEDNIQKFKIDVSNIVVGGWSYGGAIALTASIYNREIRRIISIAGADESVFGRMMQADPVFKSDFIEMLQDTVYPQGVVKFDLKSYLEHWLNHLEDYDQVKHADKLKDLDILLIGGWQDRSIIVEKHILPLYRKLQQLKSESVTLNIFDDDHSFSQSRKEMFELIVDWIKGK